VKRSGLFLLLLLGVEFARAQQSFVDQYPNSKLFTIDMERGQQILAVSEEAILFKNAMINLIYHTAEGRQLKNRYPGPQFAVIKQIDPRTLNGFQITVLSISITDSKEIGWFCYDNRKNVVFVFDREAAKWKKIIFDLDNIQYLNNCRAYCNFNDKDKHGPDGQLKDLHDMIVNDN